MKLSKTKFHKLVIKYLKKIEKEQIIKEIEFFEVLENLKNQRGGEVVKWAPFCVLPREEK